MVAPQLTYAIQPNSNLVASQLVLTWEEPEVQLACLILRGADGKQASIALANVEVDIWDRAGGAIDNEFYAPR